METPKPAADLIGTGLGAWFLGGLFATWHVVSSGMNGWAYIGSLISIAGFITLATGCYRLAAGIDLLVRQRLSDGEGAEPA